MDERMVGASETDVAPPVTSRPRARAGWLTARLAGLPPDRRFMALFLAALLAVAIVYLLFVTTETGQTIENLALRGAEFRSDQDRAAALDRLAQVSATIFGVAIAAVVVVGMLRRRPRLGVGVGLIMGASVVCVELLKDVLPRPGLVEGPAWLLRNSFPSGTAAVAAAMAIGAILISPDRLRWVVVPIAAAYGAIVADAVQTTGWHRLSDSLGGVLVVTAVFSASLALVARAGYVQPTEHGRIDWRVRRVFMLLATAAIVTGAVVLAIAAAFPLLTSPTGGRRVFLQTAFPLIGIGLVAAVILALARVVEPYTLGRRTATVAAGAPVSGADHEVEGGSP